VARRTARISSALQENFQETVRMGKTSLITRKPGSQSPNNQNTERPHHTPFNLPLCHFIRCVLLGIIDIQISLRHPSSSRFMTLTVAAVPGTKTFSPTTQTASHGASAGASAAVHICKSARHCSPYTPTKPPHCGVIITGYYTQLRHIAFYPSQKSSLPQRV
jgi:hypothetical protein